MSEMFFSIPLNNNPILTEMQAYLRTVLKGTVEYQDPATFHTTLVYVPDAPESVRDIAVPGNVPIFSLIGDSWRVFRDNGMRRWAITVELRRVPQLVHIQAAIFYAVTGAGVQTSEYSYPGLYQPHVTLAYTDIEPDLYSMPMTVAMQADKVSLTTDGYEVVAEYPLMTASATGVVREMLAKVSDVTSVWEFKGGYPSVPTFTDVDTKLLTKGDDDPMYVTLPFAEVDSVSGNQRFYDAEVVNVIEQQARDRRSVGNQGHLKAEDIGSKFDRPAGYLVGVKRSGKTVWGKWYVPPGETREMVREHRAANTPMATSIYGNAVHEYDSKRGLWRVLAEGFDLVHIDFAPAFRAGIRSLARVPHITSEMFDGGNEMGNEIVDRSTVIREMTAQDAAILPQAVRDAVLSAAPSVTVVSTLAEMLGGDDVVAAVKALISERDTLRESVVTAEMDAVLNERVKVAAVRSVVRELVQAQKPVDAAGAKKAIDEVLEREHIKEMLKGAVVNAAGPTQQRPDGAAAPVGNGMLDAASAALLQQGK